MKLTVFGSTGSVGRQVVAQAIEQGHHVTAHTRSPEKLDSSLVNLKIAEGDVLDTASVIDAIQGQDAVICTLGMPLMNTDGLRARGTRNIIRAMEGTGVRRLICLSGLGVGDSLEFLPFHYRYLIIPLLLRRVYADHRVQEAHIRSSTLDWTIARPGNFIKGTLTRDYRHGFTGLDKSLKIKISHHDVADFMIRQLTDKTYLHQAPGLSY